MPIIAALCFAALLLSACSALRIGFGQAPTLAYWWLDAYVDFSDAQTPRVRDDLAAWFAWLRQTQLQDYASLLVRAQSEALGDTTPTRTCEWWGKMRRRVDTAVAQAMPSAAALVSTLTPRQIEHVERRYAKSNEEFREDYLRPAPAKRQAKLSERAIERAESVYGRLDDAQRAQIGRAVAESPFDAELWFTDHQRRQQETLQMLRALVADSTHREDAQAVLRAFIDRLQNSPPDTYRRYAERLTQFNCELAASVHNGTSPTQRLAAAQKFKVWERDLRLLAADTAR